MIKIILLNDLNLKNIPEQKKFELWISTAVDHIPEKIPVNFTEMCISIVDKNTSAELNAGYRRKVGPTNVLSFSYDAIPGMDETSLGDLAICSEIVENEAKIQNKKLESHWAHLTIHGFLHLLGYDHVIEIDAKKMEALEIEILKKLGIENPYS